MYVIWYKPWYPQAYASTLEFFQHLRHIMMQFYWLFLHDDNLQKTLNHDFKLMFIK